MGVRLFLADGLATSVMNDVELPAPEEGGLTMRDRDGLGAMRNTEGDVSVKEEEFVKPVNESTPNSSHPHPLLLP